MPKNDPNYQKQYMQRRRTLPETEPADWPTVIAALPQETKDAILKRIAGPKRPN